MTDLTDRDSMELRNDYVSFSLSFARKKLAGFSLTHVPGGHTLSFPAPRDLFALNFKGPLGGEIIRSGHMKLREAQLDGDENKQVLSLLFRPLKVRGCAFSVTLLLELGAFDSFLRGRFVLKNEGNKTGAAVLRSIEWLPVRVPAGANSWSVPAQKKNMLPPSALRLGQPVFMGHCFFGWEFPAACNVIERGVCSCKRYYGRQLGRLFDPQGRFCTDAFVLGAAPNATFFSVRSAFFSYLRSFAKPVRMRTQHNSWFDHMMDISEDTLRRDFLQLDKLRNAAGCAPLDCFCIDDGWNDYQNDFWSFNNGFPQGLGPLSALTKSLGASLGLWLGPRGGYNKETTSFAKRLQQSGNGYYAPDSRDLCVASYCYTQKLSAFMQAQTAENDLSYWKIDGLAKSPCREKKHDHAVGGKDDVLYYTGLYESWLPLFDALHGKAKGPFHLNLTCFAIPSPWVLGWVQSIWLQNGADFELSKQWKNPQSDLDGALTFRDGVIYDFLVRRGFCVPPYALFHHDPIYAENVKFRLSDEDFFTYVLAVMCRGALLREEYFGEKGMNETKWRFLAAAEDFGTQRQSLFCKTMMIGGDPAQGEPYGYAAFDGQEGYLLLRNGNPSPQSITLCFDESIGASSGFSGAKAAVLLPFDARGKADPVSFGDTVTFDLSGFETRLLLFTGRPFAPKVLRAAALDNKTLSVTLNDFVRFDAAQCAENPIEKIEPQPDGRSAILRLRDPFAENNQLFLSGVSNLFGEETAVQTAFQCFENDLVKGCGVTGAGGFSVRVTFDGQENALLFSQGGGLMLSIEQGYALFRVGNVTLRSTKDVRSCVQICAVREQTGVLKLYLDGILDAGVRPVGAVYNVPLVQTYCLDPARTKLFCRALAFDEV